MTPRRILGTVMLIAGIILFIIGLNASESITDQVNEFFTGHFTDTTMWYLIGGIVLFIAGGLMAMSGGGKIMR
jgi:hypothetical protein